jgi:DNA or RNA helicases of superfamily II
LQCLAATFALTSKKKHAYVQAKQGKGKTIIAALVLAYLEHYDKKDKLYFITHNDALKEQVEETLSDMQVKNVRVMGPLQLNGIPGADHIVIDEAHQVLHYTKIHYNADEKLDGLFNFDKATKWTFLGGNVQPNFRILLETVFNDIDIHEF